MKKICKFITAQMGLLVLLAALFALFVPAPLRSVGTWSINPMLGLIMFGMGLTLSADDFRAVLRHPKEILIGVLAQFAAMPFLSWLLVKAFSLPPDLAIGVILVGCCPGGTASNVITYLAKGDLALSVGMTAASTLLAPLLTPLLVWLLAGTLAPIDTLGMLLSIVLVVIAPIACGVLCRKYLPALTAMAAGYLPAFSSLMIMLVVGIIVSHNADKLLSGGLMVLLVVALHNAGGLLLGYAIARAARLPMAKRAAISIEVGMQNSGLASSLAVMHFAANPFAATPGAVFSVWHNISGALAARIYARRR